MPQDRIGIIAGSGQFPLLLARAAKAGGLSVAICGLSGHADPALAAEADAFELLPIGQLNRLIKFFQSLGVTRLCFAGAVKKPKVLDLKPDWRVARLLLKVVNKGDDAILRAVAGELESEGLKVIQPAELLPSLLGPSGVLGKCAPNKAVWDDIKYGWPIARQIGQMDIGQCLVVRKRMVLAVEAIEGTDEALKRGGELGGPGATAIKILKPGQDERLDLPALGSRTIALLAEYKYACLAYQAGKTLFFDREASILEADLHNLAVIGLGPNGPEQNS